MILGYARVSTHEQTLDMQIQELKKYGCDKIYEEKVSGTKTGRPKLQEVLSKLKEGDTLVVWRLDRLGRSLTDLINIITTLNENKIKFKSLCDGAIDTTTANGLLIFNIFAALAQFERQLIKERTLAGLSAARARGRCGGRPKMENTNPKIKTAKKLHLDKTLSIDEICNTLKISRPTFYRYLKIGAE